MKRSMLTMTFAFAVVALLQGNAFAQTKTQFHVEVMEKAQEQWKHHGFYVDRVQADKVRELLLVSKRYYDVRIETAPVYLSQNLEYSSYGSYFPSYSPSLFPWYWPPVHHQPPIVIHHPIIINPPAPVIHHPIIINPPGAITHYPVVNSPVNLPIFRDPAFPVAHLPVNAVNQVNLPLHKIIVDPAPPITRAPVQVVNQPIHSAPVHNKK